MRLLSLDQSTRCTGWAFSIDGEIKAFDSIKDSAKARAQAMRFAPQEAALSPQRWMKAQIRRLVADYRPDIVAVEQVHLGENADTLIRLAEFRGRVVGMLEDFNIRVLDVASFEVSQYLHLGIGASRAQKKARAQFFSTADIYGQVAASGGGSLLPEDVADAIIILRVAEGRIKLQQWEALADSEEYRTRRNARKRARRAVQSNIR